MNISVYNELNQFDKKIGAFGVRVNNLVQLYKPFNLYNNPYIKLLNNEKYLQNNFYVPKTEVPENQLSQFDFIEANLLDVFQECYLEELNNNNSKVISFGYLNADPVLVVLLKDHSKYFQLSFDSGINWEKFIIPFDNENNFLVYFNYKFYFLSNGNKLYTTDNFIDFNEIILPISNENAIWTQFKLLNNQLIITSALGFIINSDDGINWNQTNVPNLPLLDVAFGDNKYVVISFSAYLISFDCITWEYFNFEFANSFDKLLFGCGVFLLHANNSKSYYTSTNANSWELHEFHQYIDIPFTNLSYINNHYIISQLNKSFISIDGIEWTMNQTSLQYNILNSIDINDNMMSATDTNVILFNDSIIKLPHSFISLYLDLDNICYSPDKFIVLDKNSNTVLYSSNGINWFNYISFTKFNKVLFLNNCFYAITNSEIYVSDNGIDSWDLFVTQDNIQNIVFGNNSFLLLTQTHDYYVYDLNGNLLNTAYFSEEGDFSHCALFANNLFVLFKSNSNSCFVSSNLIDWSVIALPIIANWCDIIHDGTKFIAIASNNSNLLTSPDATTWSAVDTGLTGNFSKIESYDSNLILLTSLGIFYYNNIQWSQKTNLSLNNMIVDENGLFIGVNNNIYCSSNSIAINNLPDTNVVKHYLRIG